MPSVSPSIDASLNQAWPKEGLESVPACPICAARGRELVHSGLRDRVFFCAPGEWTLYRCSDCGTGYLDPRPTPATIGAAYSKYYTHGSAGGLEPRPGSYWRRLRVAQRNAYLNVTYGYQLAPAGRVPRLSTGRRQRFDKYVCFLRYPGKGARLLDVGCGNGRLMMQMKAVGWEVFGVEPDPASAAQATASGLDVNQDLASKSLREESFDAVTLNHVIEHLHDPLRTLRRCAMLLKPGGTISIATPNLAGQGHGVFGQDWFALDPPRHLVLFTPASLRLALNSCGFDPEPVARLSLNAKEIFRRSMLVREGTDPMSRHSGLPLGSRMQATWWSRQANRATLHDPEQGEDLVLLARRR